MTVWERSITRNCARDYNLIVQPNPICTNLNLSQNFGIRTNHLILSRRPDWTFINKKKNKQRRKTITKQKQKQTRGFCLSDGSQNENKTKRKGKQIFGALCYLFKINQYRPPDDIISHKFEPSSLHYINSSAMHTCSNKFKILESKIRLSVNTFWSYLEWIKF